MSQQSLRQSVALLLTLTVASLTQAQTVGSGGIVVQDPGVRTGTIDSGAPFGSLTTSEQDFFNDARSRFQQLESVSIGQHIGLGPTFNAKSCGTCHSQPALGGTSPNLNQFPYIGANPEVQQQPPSNTPPYFVSANGPVLEARFPFFLNPDNTLSTVQDGGVHDLFTIVGLPGSGSCQISQPNFELMADLKNISFRIPTPLFGTGLMEMITEEAIIANMNLNGPAKANLGIAGRPNRNGNDGTISRFGWKAQNKSLQLFAGEAYNVEMGVTNELFQNERGNTSILNAPNSPPTSCLLNPIPEDSTNFSLSGIAILSDIVQFSHFMRFLNQPTQDVNGIPGNPSPTTIANGHTVFKNLGCNLCHTEILTTTNSTYDMGANATTPLFLSNQSANLFSDLLIHHMGPGLADGINQGLAGPDEFRTAPLWGVGQRIFFLHDGRATPGNGGLLTAIQDHDSTNSPASEAHQVIVAFNALVNGTPPQQLQAQELLDYLRSL